MTLDPRKGGSDAEAGRKRANDQSEDNASRKMLKTSAMSEKLNELVRPPAQPVSELATSQEKDPPHKSLAVATLLKLLEHVSKGGNLSVRKDQSEAHLRRAKAEYEAAYSDCRQFPIIMEQKQMALRLAEEDQKRKVADWSSHLEIQKELTQSFVRASERNSFYQLTSDDVKLMNIGIQDLRSETETMKTAIHGITEAVKEAQGCADHATSLLKSTEAHSLNERTKSLEAKAEAQDQVVTRAIDGLKAEMQQFRNGMEAKLRELALESSESKSLFNDALQSTQELQAKHNQLTMGIRQLQYQYDNLFTDQLAARILHQLGQRRHEYEHVGEAISALKEKLDRIEKAKLDGFDRKLAALQGDIQSLHGDQSALIQEQNGMKDAQQELKKYIGKHEARLRAHEDRLLPELHSHGTGATGET